MAVPDVQQLFRELSGPRTVEAYNYRHYRPRHLAYEVAQTLRRAGIRPGAVAPDFELPRVGGGSVRLHDRRDTPTLVRFTSYT